VWSFQRLRPSYPRNCLLIGAEIPSSLLRPLPPLAVCIPNTVCEQAIQIWKVWIAIDVEAQALAIIFSRPLTGPHPPARVIGVEVRTAECRPSAVRTAFDIAATIMPLADSRAAIGTWSGFHDRCFFPHCNICCARPRTDYQRLLQAAAFVVSRLS
jgi:hypothetical protein